MKVLRPILMVLLLVLAVYSMTTGDAGRTLRFLFVPDLEHFGARAVLDALGLGFFSIGVGLGLLITYAAYSPPEIDLRTVAYSSVGADTAVFFVAGLAVFPVVFANDLDPASGPGLVFGVSRSRSAPIAAALCSWVLSSRLLAEELDIDGYRLTVLRVLLKVVAPATIVAASVASFVV